MLLSACENEDIESIQYLITHYNLEERDIEGLTPLSISAKKGNIFILEMLLNSGANANSLNYVKFTQ